MRWASAGVIAGILACGGGAATATAQVRPDSTGPAASLEKKADALDEKASELYEQGDRVHALKLLEEALRLRQRALGRQHHLNADSLDSIGRVKLDLDDLPGAEAAFASAVTILRRAPARQKRALPQSLNNLAQALQRQGKLRNVERLLEEARNAQAGQLTEPEALADTHDNLGGYYWAVGAYGRSRTEHERALVLRQKAAEPDAIAVAGTLNNLGLALQELGDAQGAEDKYKAALVIRDKEGDPADLVRTLNNLATVEQEQGRRADAWTHYTRAIAVAEKLEPPNDALLGQVLTNSAVLQLLRGEHADAEQRYTRGLRLREASLGPEHADVPRSLEAFAVFLYRTGRTAEALEHEERALAIRERNLGLVLETGAESQKEQVLEALRDSIDIALTMRAAGEPNAKADQLALLTVLRRKGRLQDLLASTTNAIRLRRRPEDLLDLTRLARARESLVRLVISDPGGLSPSARDAKVRDLTLEIERVESRLSGRGLDGEARGSAASQELVQRNIPPGAVVIEFFRYRPFDPDAPTRNTRFGSPRYAAYALKHEGPPVWAELGDAEPIDRAVGEWRAWLSNRESPDIPDASERIRSLLTEPIERLAKGHTRLIISPDGDLNLLPFEALQEESGAFFIKRYLISYVTSARELTRPPQAASTSRSLIVGDPDFGIASGRTGDALRFKPLLTARAEVEKLIPLLPDAQVLTGPAASEARVKAARGPRVVHVATHGFYLSRDLLPSAAPGGRPGRRPQAAFIPPLVRSGVALAQANAPSAGRREDGILTASEAAMLDLTGTELVFLSACETGLGIVNEGESVYGLRRAFVIAGARSQILTLWKVSDRDATPMLVESFYKHLLSGLSKAEALQSAQQEALSDPGRQHPFFWAGFVLSGEPGRLTQ